jgi:hypothetical protein
MHTINTAEDVENVLVGRKSVASTGVVTLACVVDSKVSKAVSPLQAASSVVALASEKQVTSGPSLTPSRILVPGVQAHAPKGRVSAVGSWHTRPTPHGSHGVHDTGLNAGSQTSHAAVALSWVNPGAHVHTGTFS